MKYGMMAALTILGLSVSLGFLSGCETLSETPGENGTRLLHAQDINRKELPEDLERLGMLDRPSWMSRKPIPND